MKWWLKSCVHNYFQTLEIILHNSETLGVNLYNLFIINNVCQMKTNYFYLEQKINPKGFGLIASMTVNIFYLNWQKEKS